MANQSIFGEDKKQKREKLRSLGFSVPETEADDPAPIDEQTQKTFLKSAGLSKKQLEDIEEGQGRSILDPDLAPKRERLRSLGFEVPEPEPESHPIQDAIKNADLKSAVSSALGPVGALMDSNAGASAKRAVEVQGAQIATPAAKLLSRVAPQTGAHLGRKLQQIEEQPLTANEQAGGIDLTSLSNKSLIPFTSQDSDKALDKIGSVIGLGDDNPYLQVAQGVSGPIVDFAHGLGTPANIALLAATGGGGVAGKLASGAFLPSAVEGGIEGAEQLKKGITDENIKEGVAGGTGALLNSVFAKKMAEHALGRGASVSGQNEVVPDLGISLDPATIKKFNTDQIQKAVSDKNKGIDLENANAEQLAKEMGYDPNQGIPNIIRQEPLPNDVNTRHLEDGNPFKTSPVIPEKVVPQEVAPIREEPISLEKIPEIIPKEILPPEPSPPTYLRENLKQDLKSKFLLPEEKANAVMAISDARAETWAKENNKTANDWYAEKIAGVERGSKSKVKGSTEFINDGRAIIKAFQKADVSTAVHELGHVFRRDLNGIDLQVVKDWVGADKDKWERHHEEKFARGFEKYLRDGKAPNAQLSLVFEKFKRWMTNIYQKLSGSALDIKMTDDVRKVFDKLLGGRDEISPNMIEGFNVLRDQISSAEAGYRMPKDSEQLGVGGTQEWVGADSTFPIKDTGLSKQEQLAIIEKILNNDNLTDRQNKAAGDFYDFAKKYSEEKEYHDQLSKSMDVDDTSFDAQEPLGKDVDTSFNPDELFQSAEKIKGQQDLIPPRKKWATKINYKTGKEMVVRAGGEKVPQEIVQEASKFKDLHGAQTQYKDLDRAIEQVTKENYPTYRKFLIEPREDAVTAMTREHSGWKEKIDKEIKNDLGIKVGSKESAATMKYGEGRLTLEELKSQFPNKWEGIVKADKLFRGWYEQILKETNDVLVQQRKKPIPKRENYYTHAKDVANVFEKFFEKDNIDPQLAGISQFTKPTQSWNPFSKKRTGDKAFVDDAVHVFDSYLRPTLLQKHITPIIARYRAFADALASEAGKNKLNLNNFIEMMHDHANALAGKTNPMDRWLQKVTGRKVMKVVDIASQRLASNAIVGNLGSIVMQGSSLPATIAHAGNFNMAKGMISTIADTIAGKDSALDKSPWLQRRYLDTTPIKKTFGKKASDIAAKPLGIFERFMVESSWRANHAKALNKGLNGFQAIKDADFQTGRQIGNRDLGAKPLMFQSKLGNLTMQFQLEVNNMMQHYFHDLGTKEKAKVVKLIVYSHLFNLAMTQLMNRTPIFDPAGAVIDAATQEKDEKDSGAVDIGKRLGRLAGEFLGNMAGGQTLAMAVPDIQRKKYFGKTDFGMYGGGPPLLSATQKAFKNPKSLITTFGTPFGGSQYKKTSEGLKAVKDAELKGSEELKAILFGPYSIQNLEKSRKDEEGKQKFYKKENNK